MQVTVIPNIRSTPSTGNDIAYLWTDNWNDWFKYQTLFRLTYFDQQGVRHEIGQVKIGQFEMVDGQGRPELPETSDDGLDDRFFSLGQDADYYENVSKLGRLASRRLMVAMRDIAAEPSLYARVKDLDVTENSLLRSVSERSLSEQFARILDGGTKLTSFAFSYRGRKQDGGDSIRLEFVVTPRSQPPTNVHVVVGRNGVGKSSMLNCMARALVEDVVDHDRNGAFEDRLASDALLEDFDEPFTSAISVSFSAFDDFPHPAKGRSQRIRYEYVGLREACPTNDSNIGLLEWKTKQPKELAKEFGTSAGLCMSNESKKCRWIEAIEILNSDPMFAEFNVQSLAEPSQDSQQKFADRASQLFDTLSSGHKIVALTLTRLIELIEERTLVLMDEPESHLHPPLLAAMIKAISNVLIERNGVAIVATHSPVVLQEVPRSCVSKLRRIGNTTFSDPATIETYAENVGRLTHEVFSLEVTKSGFHKAISDAIAASDNVEGVLNKFGRQIGSDGIALISALIAQRKMDAAAAADEPGETA